MPFKLTGFTHDLGFRVFAFERTGTDKILKRFTVKTDLSLARRYGIRLQDLPLICRGVLEHGNEADENSSMIFTEDEMSIHAKDCAAAKDAAAKKRKTPRRPPNENLGTAWRLPTLW